MIDVSETSLPGVGSRFDIDRSEGGRLVLISHHSGRCEVLVCSTEDPDVCREVLRLSREDVRALAEVLGQLRVTEEKARARLQFQGLAIDWLPVGEKSHCIGCTLHQVEHIEDESAAIVAVIRGGTTIPTPPSDFVLLAGDTAVVVGTPRGVESMSLHLRGS
jgi:TrkA domain protein